jgi:hypothetical protein
MHERDQKLIAGMAEAIIKACAEIESLKERVAVLEAEKAKKDAFFNDPYWQKG